MNERVGWPRIRRHFWGSWRWVVARPNRHQRRARKHRPATASALPSDAAMPLLTPTGVVSSVPPPASAPSASAAPTTTAGPRLSPDGKMCGGIAGFQCPDKHYCSFAIDAHCGAGDMAGTCKPIPDLCTMEFAPVLRLRPSDVLDRVRRRPQRGSRSRRTARVRAIAARSSPTERRAARAARPASVRKARTARSARNAALPTRAGKCSKKPEVCPHLVAPVCGCDHQTYQQRVRGPRARAAAVSSQGCL